MIYWNQVNFEQFRESASRRGKHHYSPFVAALDTETTTIAYQDKKIAFMYIWQMAIEDVAFYGRTWEEFRHCLSAIKKALHLSSAYKLVVYVHKLKYDFSFYKNEVNLEGKLIARSPRTILLHTLQDAFEVRDSGAYTEQPLEELGVEVGIPKLPGYDYTKIRTFDTPLTKEELAYCENDVLILTKYFRREAEKYRSVSNIPLTVTRRIKRIIQHEFYSEKDTVFRSMVLSRQLKNTPLDQTILSQLKHAFFGAFTYSNIAFRGVAVENVIGVDLDTCYGAQCLLHKYPMGKFEPLPLPDTDKVEEAVEDLKNNSLYKGKALLITFAAKNISPKYADIGFLPTSIKNYWSRSALDGINKSAKHLLVSEKIVITLTDVDFFLFIKFYNYTGVKLVGIFGSDYGPMPDYMIRSVCNMYDHKIELKTRNEKILEQRPLTLAEGLEYTHAKTGVSRIYGILVQDPIRPEYGWDPKDGKVKAIEDRTKNLTFDPVLFQWGVWIVAWARYEILKLLYSFALQKGTMRSDIVLYSDTDSLYLRETKTTNELIVKYNQLIDKKIQKFCASHRLEYQKLKKIGKLKEEKFEKFKTTGLKQYAFIQNGTFDYRCSGLPRPDYDYTEDGKKKLDHNGNVINKGMSFFDIFNTVEEKLEAFHAELSIPAEHAHARMNVYYDTPLEEPILVTDYLGGSVLVHPKSWVVIEETGFDFDKNPFSIFEHMDEERFTVIEKKFGI